MTVQRRQYNDIIFLFAFLKECAGIININLNPRVIIRLVIISFFAEFPDSPVDFDGVDIFCSLLESR